jgi:uncharacterized protein YjbI with pentapeptide repeats
LRTSHARGERSFRDATFAAARFENFRLDDCDFSGAQINNVTFTSSSFTRCRFERAKLRHVTFLGCHFTDCDLSYSQAANLSFRSSSLVGCTLDKMLATDSAFHSTRMSHSRCFNIRLDGTHFIACDITLSSFDHALMQQTSFVATNLGAWAESRDVWFGSGANVDWRSVSLSLRSSRLEGFLLATKMPEAFVHYMIECARTLDPNAVFRMMRSTFISYGGPDAEFARRLRDDLQRAGVRTFLFEDDARPGEKLHDVMRDGVNRFERIVLVCSKASLDRKGVLNEIEQALAREAREGGVAYLIPVTIDNYVFSWSPQRPQLAQELRDRVVADFRGTQDNDRRYSWALQRLLAALAT